MSIKKLIREFAEKKKTRGKTASVFYEHGAIYSYGHHFPMAYIRGTRAFINSDRYSVTTSKHQGYVRAALAGYECKPINTADLKALIDSERAQ